MLLWSLIPIPELGRRRADEDEDEDEHVDRRWAGGVCKVAGIRRGGISGRKHWEDTKSSQDNNKLLIHGEDWDWGCGCGWGFRVHKRWMKWQIRSQLHWIRLQVIAFVIYKLHLGPPSLVLFLSLSAEIDRMRLLNKLLLCVLCRWHLMFFGNMLLCGHTWAKGFDNSWPSALGCVLLGASHVIIIQWSIVTFQLKRELAHNTNSNNNNYNLTHSIAC